MKWESLLERSRQIGADYIATGHYARIDRLENGRYSLRTSKTGAKDQTYALYNLTQDQLASTLMPVGEYTKEQIRQMAKDMGLLVADKPDSQDICFVPDGDYASFIEGADRCRKPAGQFCFVRRYGSGGLTKGNHPLYGRTEKRTGPGAWTAGIRTGNPAGNGMRSWWEAMRSL